MDGLKIDAGKTKALMLVRGIEEQKELAKLAKVSQNTISTAMNGETVSGRTVVAIARALKASPADVLDLREYESPLLGASASTVGILAS